MDDRPELPAPITPADSDLTDFGFMPLHLTRLRQSKTWSYARRNPALGFYLVNLWASAWHSLPAGSLEDDDLVLADAAQCDDEAWPELRDQILRGWTKHADGRLYHEVVAELVNEAWQRKVNQRERSRRGNEARWGGRAAPSLKDPSGISRIPPPD
jgi:Protein of unknown function (DUF1376)